MSRRDSVKTRKVLTPNYLVVGNPGSGKSTLINGVIGEPVFDARPSYTGSGITFKFDQKYVPGWGVFMDTPGLADEEKKHQAAAAITEALTQNGFYKIFFIITPTNGRIQTADKSTMKLILEAATTITDYAVVGNQVELDWIEHMYKSPILYQNWVTKLNADLPVKTTSIIFIPKVPALANQSNVKYKAPQEITDFVRQCPGMDIQKEHVGTINADSFENIQKEFEDKTKVLESNTREMEREMQKQRSEMIAAQARAEEAREMSMKAAAARLESDRRDWEREMQQQKSEMIAAQKRSEARADAAERSAQQRSEMLVAQARADAARSARQSPRDQPAPTKSAGDDVVNTAGRLVLGAATGGVSELFRRFL